MALPSSMRLPGRAAALGGCEAQTTCCVGSHFCGIWVTKQDNSPREGAGCWSSLACTRRTRLSCFRNPMVGIRGAAGEGAGTGGPITQTAAQPGGNSQAESHVLL